ncbi:metallophosphoesterase [Treponema sp.]|uniref:metallophosphoesterase n=1 Tax=Treponema sp. TaxID=166 RepID=UPI00298D9065|nr:metallophosphoesterase [Treponema sp.]MCQ2242448.1 metallophosphoesterase [Treponema sp.]
MLTEEQLLLFRQQLQKIVESQSFPKESEFQFFLDRAITVLENEDPSYRPLNLRGNSGGLLDFTASELPVIIVPDIHGRADFLLKLMDSKINSDSSVLENLNEGKVTVICVGDAVHGEIRAYERWVKSFKDWQMDVYAGPSMQEEMKENIAVWQIIMMLKNQFPEYFHFLKGNHENVTNETGHGNHSFRKFVSEGQMCCDFIRQVYGDAVLHLISLWEKALPLCAVFSSFCVSHAEPYEVYSRDQVINCYEEKNLHVVEGLTWTRNDEVFDNTCKKNLKKLNSKAKCSGVLWFGGHRPVKDANYFLRQKGAYLQLHNPDEMNVAYVVPGNKFNPDEDVIGI